MPAGRRAAVAAGGGVAELVEAGGGDREREDEQQQLRAVERLAASPTRRPCGTSTNQQTATNARDDRPHDPRPEEERERRRQPAS